MADHEAGGASKARRGQGNRGGGTPRGEGPPRGAVPRRRSLPACSESGALSFSFGFNDDFV